MEWRDAEEQCGFTKSKESTVGACIGCRGAWREAEEHGLIERWVKGYTGVQGGAGAA